MLAVIYTLVRLGQPALSFRGPCRGHCSLCAYWIRALGSMLDAARLPEAGGGPAAPHLKDEKTEAQRIELAWSLPSSVLGPRPDPGGSDSTSENRCDDVGRLVEKLAAT